MAGAPGAVLQQLSTQITLDAGATVLASIPPIQPRDQLDSLVIYLVSDALVAQLGESITVSVYANNSVPATAAEAAAGVPVQATTVLPLDPVISPAGTYLYRISLDVPLLFAPAAESRQLSAVLVGAANADLAGVLYFKVFRPTTNLKKVSRDD